MKIMEVGTFEAKTHFSKLLDEVERGTTIYITRHGKKVAEMKPLQDKTKPIKRGFGCMRSENFYMAPDFDAPLEEFKEYM